MESTPLCCFYRWKVTSEADRNHHVDRQIRSGHLARNLEEKKRTLIHNKTLQRETELALLDVALNKITARKFEVA